MKDKTLKKFLIKCQAPFKRSGLKNRDYTIISNNCYGGIVSWNFGLPYNSPTCGTFFYSKEYLKFLNDLEAHIQAELSELKAEESLYKDFLLPKYSKNIVLGKVVDAEIVFLHYSSFAEAKEKWDRRKRRINWDNLIIKYNDQNLFSLEDYDVFEKLPYKNKIFFTANKQLKNKKDAVYLDCFESQGYAVDDIQPSRKYFNIKKYLNNVKVKQ